MSAQYRPYRDEESVDGMEATSWSDNEPGTIQIYEKTTEELPFNVVHKKALWVQIALVASVGLLGFLLGYFAPFHPTSIATLVPSSDGLETDLESSKHYESYFSHEDPTIKDKLLGHIDGNNILALLKAYEDSNRLPGSDHDHKFAKHVQDLFSSYELDRVTSSNYTFRTMLPSKPTVIKLISKDNTTLYSNIEHEKYNHDDMRPFLPLSQANETVIITNKILYVNRGTKEDYIKLSSLGVSLNETEDKVLVIRQGFYQAHDIVISAQELGAKAILLFPDPDIYGTSSPFPKLVRLPDDAGRSHPTAWSNYGDLASVNLSAVNGADASKLGLDKDSKVQIPVIPISFKTAQKILRGLSGAQAPSEWNCFDFTLYLGTGYREENNEDKRDRIRIEFNNQETSITTTTVTGILEGSAEPDRYIILGSRRDSLNRGLLDSVSGTAVMLELARVFSLLLKQGWRPKRTIIFNSFGAESFNLIGSSNWLETHQRLLHSRAVAYLNCDLVVTGNRSAAIAASPLLYQVLFNSTKQVPDPNAHSNRITLYDAWVEAHKTKVNDEVISSNKLKDPELEKVLDDYELTESKLPKSSSETLESTEDGFGTPGSILREYRKSATVKTRPRVRRLDLHSIYSPFFLYAGIPVLDVHYAGFSNGVMNSGNNNVTNLMEDMLPLIGTKYDNMATIQHIDPHLKYHVAVTQMLSEVLRDLSDSVFLPFNLLDYAVTLKDSFNHFVAHYGKMFNQSNVELESLKQSVQEFSKAAIRFHHRQDLVNPRDALKVRKFNDQLMLLERAFIDPSGMPNHWDRKHLILTPNEGQEKEEGFPGLVDWINLMDVDLMDVTEGDYSLYIEILKVNYRTVVYTISNAIKTIEDVHIL